MKYWYDTEFYEGGERIHLISMGMVAEDGRELYVENAEFNWDIVPPNHWIRSNVLPHLRLTADTLRYKAQIANQVRRFLTKDGTEYNNELWGYYSAYDHVVLAQLFGRMVDMPDGVPWFTQDIKQLQAMLHEEGWDYEFPKQVSTQHHALEDARWTRIAYENIMEFAHEYQDW